MNGALGMAGIALGLAASVLGGVTLVVGLAKHRLRLVRSGTVYVWLVLAGAVLAVIAMERALITRDFSLSYVAEVGSSRTPALYNVASLWSALDGSILLWTIILALYLAATLLWFRRRLSDPLVTWALVVLFAISTFFFLLLAGPANPFGAVSGAIPLDGPGPNPLLQNHPLMVIHPPMLYLGYVGFSVPFAFAIGGLITGRVGEGWLLDTRRWTLFAWGFLSAGIVLGAWWSYEVLGWGGVWGWDPVENASLLPWLTGTAFIHSVLVQERRGMLRVWNLSLLAATFCLTILGTFLTRSGVIESVHAFSDGPIGVYLLMFFALAAGTSIGLIGWRGDRLRSPGSIDSPLSREGAFLANNVLFALFAFVVLLGTVFPLVVEALQDRRLSVGRPFFDRMTTPLGLALLTLMAIAPVLPWRKASAELLRHRLFWPACLGVACVVVPVLLGADGLAPLLAFGLGGFAAGSALRQLVLATRRQGWRGLVGRANGGMVVHVGVIIIAVALAAQTSYQRSGEFRLSPGETATFGGHRFTLLDQVREDTPAAVVLKARIRIDDGPVHAPARQQFKGRGDIVATPSVRTGLAEDVYLTLLKPSTEDDARVTFGVRLMPLSLWLWTGGALMAVGTVLAAFPGRRRRPTDPASAPIMSRPADEVAARQDEAEADLVAVPRLGGADV
ncbi:MAG TPA: heme lyase CcmF/NrfE family subunit [Acidimicrobiales bacterium]|nr:heme lyase CcmF/NrfE family subunit [Acidimicrobiales bacterium]